MISVKEAKELLGKNAWRLETENVPLHQALGRILAEDLISPVDHPLFDQTAVDGYAFRFSDFVNQNGNEKALEVIGEIPAGSDANFMIGQNQAVRIFTGAPVPDTTDTVVMQEKTALENSKLQITDDKLQQGANIRKKGGQIKKGDLALSAGSALNPVSLGFISSLGIWSVQVSKLPKVGIIITGNEFAESLDDLKEGKIFESNGIMLKNALQKMGIHSEIEICKDDLNLLQKTVESKWTDCDVIIITGGVSVGDYDFTRPALEEAGFKTVFHKVSQMPGKPILFATKTNKAALGLPGNPRSVMVCFYEYAYPFLRMISGAAHPFLPSACLPLAHDYHKKGDRAFFAAVKIEPDGISLSDKQASHMLQSLSAADALACFPENDSVCKKGDLVEVHFLPNLVN